MSLAFNEAQFSSFIQFLKQDSMGHLVIRKAVTLIGEQCDQVWVLSRDLHINADGSVIPASDQTHVWMDAIIKDGLGTITPEEVIPAFPTPLVPGTEILNTVVKHLRVIMRHNFFPAILMAGGAVMALHYSRVVSTGGCPIVVAHGCSETGKSTAIRVGLSILGKCATAYSVLLYSSIYHLGTPEAAIYEKVTNSFILERASASTMPFAIDDPTKVPSKNCDLSDVIVELHNGGKFANLRSGAQYAKSMPLAALNYSLRKEERCMCISSQAITTFYMYKLSFSSCRVTSRTCIVPFTMPTVSPQNEEQQEAFDTLDDILEDKQPSAAVCWAIQQHAVVTQKHEIRQMKQSLQGSFKGRAQRNWALLTLCGKQVCTLVNSAEV